MRVRYIRQMLCRKRTAQQTGQHGGIKSSSISAIQMMGQATDEEEEGIIIVFKNDRNSSTSAMITSDTVVVEQTGWQVIVDR